MHESGVPRATARSLVELAVQIRRLREQGLAEGPGTRLLVSAARLIARGIPPREACRIALAGPLTDDPDLLARDRRSRDADDLALARACSCTRHLRNRAIRLTRRVAVADASVAARARRARTLPSSRSAVARAALAAMYGTPMPSAAAVTSARERRRPSAAARRDARARDDASHAIDCSRSRRPRGRATRHEHARRRRPRSRAICIDSPRARQRSESVATRVPSLVAATGAAALRRAGGHAAGRLRLAHTERRVESTARARRSRRHPIGIPSDIPVCATPGESRAWAEATADEIRRDQAGARAYRPRNPMSCWGLAGRSRVAEPTDEPLGPAVAVVRHRILPRSRARATDATRRVRSDDSGDDDASPTDQGDATDAGDDRHATLVRSSADGGPATEERETDTERAGRRPGCATRPDARREAARRAASAERGHRVSRVGRVRSPAPRAWRDGDVLPRR